MREIEYPSYSSIAGPRLHWSSIFAGTVMCMAVMATLMILGAGIGFLAAPAADSGRGLAAGLGIGGAGYMLVSGLVSFYTGGWFASRLSDCGRPADGVLYGLVSWGVATLVGAFMFTTAVTGVLSAAGGAVAKTASGTAQGVGAAASARAGDGSIEDRIRSAGDELRRQARRTRQDVGGGNVDRGDIAEKAETASQAAGAVGIAGFVTLLLEGLAAALGGRAGARLYLPVPVGEFRGRRERETATVR